MKKVEIFIYLRKEKKKKRYLLFQIEKIKSKKLKFSYSNI